MYLQVITRLHCTCNCLININIAIDELLWQMQYWTSIKIGIFKLCHCGNVNVSLLSYKRWKCFHVYVWQIKSWRTNWWNFFIMCVHDNSSWIIDGLKTKNAVTLNIGTCIFWKNKLNFSVWKHGQNWIILGHINKLINSNFLICILTKLVIAV